MITSGAVPALLPAYTGVSQTAWNPSARTC